MKLIHDRPGEPPVYLASEDEIDYTDEEINAALPNAAIGTMITTAGYGTIRQKAEDGSWVTVTGGGSSTTVEELSVTENGTYTADTGKAYSPVTVTVPQTTVESLSVTENGTYTAPTGKAYSPVTVSVSGDPALPSEYQEVEYLTNDGYCWCEINCSIYNHDKIAVSFSLSSDAPSTECGLCGKSTSWEILTQNNAVTVWGYSMSGSTVSISRDAKVNYSAIFTDDTTDFLWGRYKEDKYPFTGNMYSCRLYAERGELVFTYVKLVPCYRKADNVPGFYDVINSVFYTNQGTGTFGIGPDVT